MRNLRTAIRTAVAAGVLMLAAMGIAFAQQGAGVASLPEHASGDTYVYDIDGDIQAEEAIQGVAGHYVWRFQDGTIELRYADPTLPPERRLTPRGEEVVKRIYTHSAHTFFPAHVWRGSQLHGRHSHQVRTGSGP